MPVVGRITAKFDADTKDLDASLKGIEGAVTGTTVQVTAGFSKMEGSLAKTTSAIQAADGAELWLNERFALLTGLRIGEQAHLRQEHFQTPGYVRVPEEGKTGERMVPLCREAREIAAKFLDRAAKNGHEYVFWGKYEAKSRLRAGESHVRRYFRPACAFIGLKGYQRRDLRRTFATRLIQAGVGIYNVQHLLGHTTPTMTD